MDYNTQEVVSLPVLYARKTKLNPLKEQPKTGLFYVGMPYPNHQQIHLKSFILTGWLRK